MLKNTIWGGLIVCVLAMLAPSAFAGKVELTTYCPAPYGEYSEVQASQKLKVPVQPTNKTVATTTPGEIWVEQ